MRDVAIPLAVCFGLAGSSELYEGPLKAFRGQMGMDLSGFSVQSDHRAAVTTACEKH
jgi:hypothetical protein